MSYGRQVACNKSSTAAETHADVCGWLELGAGAGPPTGRPEWSETSRRETSCEGDPPSSARNVSDSDSSDPYRPAHASLALRRRHLDGTGLALTPGVSLAHAEGKELNLALELVWSWWSVYRRMHRLMQPGVGGRRAALRCAALQLQLQAVDLALDPGRDGGCPWPAAHCCAALCTARGSNERVCDMVSCRGCPRLV